MNEQQKPTELERFDIFHGVGHNGIGEYSYTERAPDTFGEYCAADNALAIAAERDANAAEIVRLRTELAITRGLLLSNMYTEAKIDRYVASKLAEMAKQVQP